MYRPERVSSGNVVRSRTASVRPPVVAGGPADPEPSPGLHGADPVTGQLPVLVLESEASLASRSFPSPPLHPSRGVASSRRTQGRYGVSIQASSTAPEPSCLARLRG